jgi:hypothetical protein
MPNSPQIAFLAHNSTVKAWCWAATTTTRTTLTNPNQTTVVDPAVFIDGYNLRLDSVSHTNATIANYPTDEVYSANTNASGVGIGPYGAIRFAFITPMPDTKYKVFVQWSVSDALNQYIPYAHALNSSIYPKTTTGFWVRAGIPTVAIGSTKNQMTQATFLPSSNMRVIVL